MNKEKARISKQYCGAVAVSWYNKDYTYEAIRMLLDAGVKTNVHYVLSNSSIEEAIMRIQYNRFSQRNQRYHFLVAQACRSRHKSEHADCRRCESGIVLREVMKTDRMSKSALTAASFLHSSTAVWMWTLPSRIPARALGSAVTFLPL